MTSQIAALNHYRPRIQRSGTIKRKTLVHHIADRTGLNEGEILLVLLELRDAVVFFNRIGRGVKLEGLGTYLPNINYKGEFDVVYHMDVDFKAALNFDPDYRFVLNRQHIGKSAAEVVALWNEKHPDDPVRG